MSRWHLQERRLSGPLGRSSRDPPPAIDSGRLERDLLVIDEIQAAYDWFRHPDGPLFVETHRDAHRTSGHFLFLPGVFSSFHKVENSEELWLIHAGRLRVHVLDPASGHRELRLGLHLEDGDRPVVSVPAGCWQAAEIESGVPFAFGSNVCAPGFSFEAFAIADREELLREFAAHRDLILRLTRAGGGRGDA